MTKKTNEMNMKQLEQVSGGSLPVFIRDDGNTILQDLAAPAFRSGPLFQQEQPPFPLKKGPTDIGGPRC